MSIQPVMSRRLGLADAVFLGLGSMIGAGVFAAFTPAAAAAGSGLLIGLLVGAVVALCNATSSAQLAAEYPTSGGTYVYGRERLGPWPGFFAGWCFVIGKTASCMAMAMTFAAYAAPAGWQKPVAVLAVLALAAVNYVGVTRTALVTRIIVVVALLALAVGVAAGLGSQPRPNGFGSGLLGHGWYAILQSAGLLFFAFAGYARIATLGEEVRDPRRIIPRAIVIALALTMVIYAVVGVTVLVVLGPDGVATTRDPLAAAAARSGWPWAEPVVRVGAAAASLGALLALITGIGRTSLAMARQADLPRWFAALHPRFDVPHRAEVALALVVVVGVLTADLRGAIGFSSFGVLLYYLIANLSAWTQTLEHRRYPRWLQALGAVGCLTLVATLPPRSILIGLGVLAIGLCYRLVRLRLR
ncbi:APA family basic amino acid/polyamine antiporter [Microlunatus panaciterrae]|uniref:APA family basic amino acid/polyamine antiporter n=1 Tax=Microlunatus panaciterrae TaxID=400768 RepID=A0ABS2RHD1_9ACTN|nr:APA family basic amino acid/polyamine antiporter [Microlunatus panaciterrae]